MRRTHNGFGHVLLLIFLVAVAVVAFAGYRVYSSRQNTAAKTTTASSQNTSGSELTSANKDLTQAGAELDNSLDDSALNADLDSM